MTFDDDARGASAPTAPKPLLTFKASDARYAGLPNYIFGLHDAGGEGLLLDANKPGWLVVSAQVNPPDSTGNFARLAERGLGVIVRLNNGYGSAGTIPEPAQYDQFAQQCAQFVSAAQGAHIWLIGNEPNTAFERPGNDGSANSGQVITPDLYARCFIKCRQAIRAVPGREHDWVIPAPVGPFNTQTTYPTNPNGDWVRYFAEILFQITVQGGGADGLALHTYTHGYDANLVSSDALAGGNFTNRHWHFRAYRDLLAAVLPAMKNLPVFITETQPVDPGWINANRGWIQAAYAEVNAWNSNPANQPIQAVCLFRWQALPGDPSGWGMSDKPQVVGDFRAALESDYRVRWPGIQPTPDYRAQWITALTVPGNSMTTGEVVTGRVVVKNTGAKAWFAGGANPVRVGYHWYNQQGIEIPVAPDPGHFALTQNILPGQTAIVDEVKLRAPQWDGTYTVRFDLVQEGSVWFSARGSPTKDVTITVHAPPYAVEWEQVIAAPADALATNAELFGAVRVKNVGSRTWFKSGPNPVRLGFQWFNAQGFETPVAPYAGNFDMAADTPPGKTAVFEGVVLRAPQWDGDYTLRWDLAHEGITWFSAQGSATREQVVAVKTPIPDLAANWVHIFDIPTTLEPNETVAGSLTVQNAGLQGWDASNVSGANPVRLGYRWYDAEGKAVSVAPYAGDFPLKADTPHNGAATFDHVIVRAPIAQGNYKLVFDLAQEGVTWFAETGNPPLEFPITVKTDAPDYLAAWQEIIAIPNDTLITDEAVRGRVVVRNAGAKIWQAEGARAVRLAYRWLDASGNAVLVPAVPSLPSIPSTPTGSLTFALPHAVAPRDAVAFDDVVIQAPDTAGEYTLRWDLWHEGGAWFSAAGSPTADIGVRVKPPPLAWGAEFAAHNTPARLVVGQSIAVDLRLKNIGKNLWQRAGDNPVHAAYKWLNAAGQPQLDVEDHRTALPDDVSVGGEVEFAATLATPRTPGAYRLQWDLVAEGVLWFAEGGNPALNLPMRVTATPAPTHLWRAEASHNASSALLAIDGDLGSFWSSQVAQAPGMWFRVNLGEPHLIDSLAFRSPGQGHPSGYTVRVSSDGAEWRTVGGIARDNARDVVVYFAPYAVLYAQVDLLSPGAAEWMIGDVQIHPTPPWNATASVNSETAPNVIDNHAATAWVTETQTPHTWFQLDLGRIESVSGLKMVPPQDENPAGYRVSVWNHQAGGWQKVAERTNNAEPINISFAPLQTQYINIQLLQASDKPWAIREARVTKAALDWIGPTCARTHHSLSENLPGSQM